MPFGGPNQEILGDSTVTSARTYTPDGMPSTLRWTSSTGAVVRAHTNILYDVGGLRTAEDGAVTQPVEAVGVDTGGAARYSYDLLDRLTAYTSPYKQTATDTADPDTTY